MPFRVQDTELPEVKVVIPERFHDRRGYFAEIYRADLFRRLGLPDNFVQVNHSHSVRHTIRGLHFQWDPPMGKLMRVTVGEAFLVAVDIRRNSPTLGRWVGQMASEGDGLMLWAPACFARGFCVLSEYADVEYLCTGTYNGACESGIFWNDPAIGIKWPVPDPVLSDRDRSAPTLKQWLESAHGGVFDEYYPGRG